MKRGRERMQGNERRIEKKARVRTKVEDGPTESKLVMQ